MTRRIHELDSLRGIAALIVVLAHIINIIPPLPNFLLYSPLRIIWAGHESVILFFILSGFVLSLPFIKGKNINYKTFLIKRFFRIYIPYICAIIITLILINITYKEPIEDIRWLNNFWTLSRDTFSIFNHFLLVTNFNSDQLNPVIWSLIHEMRISLIFPIIMYIILKIDWKKSLLLSFFLSFIGWALNTYEISLSSGYLNSYAHSIHYTAMFIIGALLAIHLNKLTTVFKNISFNIRLMILTIGFMSYTLQIGLGYFLNNNSSLFVREWFVAFGACIFIIFALTSSGTSKILSLKPIEFLGNISYSLYLYHLPVMLASFYYFNETLSFITILLISLIFSLIISTISYKFIEVNSIKMGKYFSTSRQISENENSKMIS